MARPKRAAGPTEQEIEQEIREMMEKHPGWAILAGWFADRPESRVRVLEDACRAILALDDEGAEEALMQAKAIARAALPAGSGGGGEKDG